MALFHLLLEVQKTLPFSLHLAHVDHGWRVESQREAQALKEMAKALKIPFHFKALEKMEGRDLENRARNSRYCFFSQLQKTYQFQAVLVGHHRKDQAETVFKRVAEGSGIEGLGGIYPETKRGNLLIWRPLLSLSKESLFAYLEKKGAHFFEDRTNKDFKYLRSRMRGKLFPSIEETFGKKIEGNFARLGKFFQELSVYFQEKSERIKRHVVYGPFGASLNLSLGFHPLELKYFLKKIAPLSYPALERLVELVEKGAGSRLIHAHPYTFQLSRSYLFIYREPFPDFFEHPERWVLEKSGDWQTFWGGRMKAPKEGSALKRASELEPVVRKKLKKWYSACRVPAFFYEKAPVFVRGQKVVGEPLTGRDLCPSFPSRPL